MAIISEAAWFDASPSHEAYGQPASFCRLGRTKIEGNWVGTWHVWVIPSGCSWRWWRAVRRGLWALPLMRASRPVFKLGGGTGTAMQAQWEGVNHCSIVFLFFCGGDCAGDACGWFIRGYVTGLLRFVRAVIFMRVSLLEPPHTIHTSMCLSERMVLGFFLVSTALQLIIKCPSVDACELRECVLARPPLPCCL